MADECGVKFLCWFSPHFFIEILRCEVSSVFGGLHLFLSYRLCHFVYIFSFNKRKKSLRFWWFYFSQVNTLKIIHRLHLNSWHSERMLVRSSMTVFELRLVWVFVCVFVSVHGSVKRNQFGKKMEWELV